MFTLKGLIINYSTIYFFEIQVKYLMRSSKEIVCLNNLLDIAH